MAKKKKVESVNPPVYDMVPLEKPVLTFESLAEELKGIEFKGRAVAFVQNPKHIDFNCKVCKDTLKGDIVKTEDNDICIILRMNVGSSEGKQRSASGMKVIRDIGTVREVFVKLMTHLIHTVGGLL